jgi:hypothetical protein
MADPLVIGNAIRDGAAHRQWFLGPFLDDPAGLRQTDHLEVKWGVHRRGESRADWAPAASALTLSVLVRGRFQIEFRTPGAAVESRRVVLAVEGDYALWSPEVEHTWLALEDSVVLTVRWPAADEPVRDRMD